MKNKLNFIVALLALLIFSNSIFASYNTIDLNTGLNHNNAPATLYAVGAQDPFWRVLSPGTPQSSTVHNVYPGWAQPQANSQWVFPGTYNAGFYTYERCFCLRSVSDANLNVTLLRADNRAWLYLNNFSTPVLETLKNYSFSPTRTPAQGMINQGFVVGANCIRIVVQNNEGPTGFNLAASVSGHGAKEIVDQCCTPPTSLSTSEEPALEN